VSDELIEYGETVRNQSLESGNRLVAFGGSDPRKNVSRIVEAFRRVREVFAQAELFIVGCQGSQQRRYQEVPGLHLLPYISESELLGLYSSARALIYPSLSEGFGVPIIEAMAVGLPVITSDRGAMRELADGIGHLVDPEDVSSIASAILDVMANANVSTRRAQSGRLKAKEFSASEIARQTTALYHQVADCPS
jgi:glycosyltransferase involved in cell wall biosynthesis